MKILRKYEAKYPHIQVFQNETNIGGEANFNKCIENMEGEFGAIYHADDVYMPTIVEEEVDFLMRHYSSSAISTHASFIDENGCKIGEHFVPDELKESREYVFDFKEFLKYGNIVTCPSVMCRTNIFKII